MIATTGCDGVMIARGCLGNPFIFSQAEALLQGRPAEARIGPGERLSIAISHLRLLADSVGEDKACRDMRKHFVAYTKGLEGGSVVRQSVVHAARIDEYEEIVESYLRD
jgi:tRNA-dihydrouridine synthase